MKTGTSVEFCPYCMAPRNMRVEQGNVTYTRQGAVNRAAIFVRYHCETCGLFVRLKTQDAPDGRTGAASREKVSS